MKIELRKTTPYECEYTVTRNNGAVEVISLDTKTYFLHDICHYVVEKKLGYANGFWGMLADGFTFQQLFGKDNPQTSELRFIEQIVGPVQSVYWGHIPQENFEEYIAHLEFTMDENLLNLSLTEIKTIMDNWVRLPQGQQLILDWNV